MMVKFKKLKWVFTFAFLALASLTVMNSSISDPVSEIEKLGGKVKRHCEYEIIYNLVRWLDRNGWSKASKLLTRRFYPVVIVILDTDDVRDEHLVHLEGLTMLYALTLSDTHITDTGLVHLEGLTELIHLSLRGTQITDAGLVHLNNLSNLRDLNLRETQTTEEARQKLERAIPGLDIR